MEGFWGIMSGWTGFGQGLFLLIVLGGLFTLIRQVVYYVSVSFRGWPPEGTVLDDEENTLL